MRHDVNHELLGRVSAGQDLTTGEATQVVDQIMRGQWPENEIGLLLTAWQLKGETAAEIAGAAAAMRQHMTRIHTDRGGVIDTCGTGGDGSGTFNISTAAALVAAAAGVPVAKHGNRRVSSCSGSADVLEQLGVNVSAGVPTVERCLDRLGVCFCFAPLLHQAMKQVSPVRQRLGVPTIFNLLGPLTNPASAPFQLLGVGQAPHHAKLATALSLLGVRRAVVVRGRDGLDEVSLSCETDVIQVDGQRLREFSWTPEDFGLQRAGQESMLVSGPAESAAMIQEILSGTAGPPRDIVVLNAAAALWTTGLDPSPRVCAQRAADAIDQGSARQLLRDLAEASHAC
jgi:anthranilate phosphoribosyltransferase